VLWIVAILLVYITALFAVFYSAVSTVAALPPESSAASAGMNVLIVGSDSRAGLTEEQQNELSTGSVEGNRTDTIMLLHAPLFGKPTLVSIPRDSWVPIPGYGSDKINSAFALGGPQLLVRTVEDVTGLQITDYVEVGFAGVAATTDAMGGVVLCPNQDFNDENSGLNVKAGCQTMDGPTALAYVRMRYADPRGDLGRVERQQEYVAAVAKRGMSPLTWLLPWRAFPAARAAGKALTVSNSTGVVDLTRIGIAMGAIGAGWGTSVTVPTEEDPLIVDGQDALKWKTDEALALFNGLR
jgi:LCP family protein required for cell wall assembly